MTPKTITMLEYIKSFPANCDIPAGFMTFGELAEIIEERNDLLEGMKLIVSIKGNDELAKADAWSDPRTPEQIDMDAHEEETQRTRAMDHPLF